jgi:hypothetical protein
VRGQIYVHRTGPVGLIFIIILEGRVLQGDASIIDQDVQAAQSACNVVNQRHQGLPLGDIAHEARGRLSSVNLSNLGDNTSYAFGRYVGDSDASPFVRENVSCRPAHAGTGARNQNTCSRQRT